MTTVYVPYQINTVNNLPGFLAAPTMVCDNPIESSLVDKEGTPTTVVSVGFLVPALSIYNVEEGYTLVFAITNTGIEDWMSVPAGSWKENIWEATMTYTSTGNKVYNLWGGLKKDGVVETGDYCSSYLVVSDPLGLIP